MTIQIYNTLSRRKEPLEPLRPDAIGIYSCGVTPYDLCHVGHARSVMVFDVVCRYLAFKGHRVTFVRNFTDVDDKIIRRAQREGVAPVEIADRYIDAFRTDMKALNVLPPAPGVIYHDPKATDFVEDMVALIARLVEKGYAYPVDVDVYFEVARFAEYGKLSGRNLDELLAGARVEVDERKRDPRDFALWKAAKPGEPSWPSPWGEGRPGWHVECSVMSSHFLGTSFDIHGGGADLIFPHHECEIAQSEADTGRMFARYWMHNGLVNLGTEKMSKSLGNIMTIREILSRYDADALRLWLLQTHYRNPVQFTEERLGESETALRTLWNPVEKARTYAESETFGTNQKELTTALASYRNRFVAAMDDDFNTPQAIAVLFELGRALNQGSVSVQDFVRGAAELSSLAGILGFRGPQRKIHGHSREETERIEALIKERAEARKRRDWKRADELRAEIDSLGAIVEDTPVGPQLRWKG